MKITSRVFDVFFFLILVYALSPSFSFAVSTPSDPDPRPDFPQGWFKLCTQQKDIGVCNVQNILTAETGQLLTGISLIELKGKENRKFLQVSVPSARLVKAGIFLQIDAKKEEKIDYLLCLPDRCIAEMPLSESLIASFKKGNVLTLTSVNFQNHRNPVEISLKGFSSSFDGPPIKQADLDERQRKIREFVNKNNANFSKKLKEEQEKMKTPSP